MSAQMIKTPVVAPQAAAPVTGEELFTMSNVGSAELIKGEIVHKMPTGRLHGFLEALIASLLVQFVFPRQVGQVLSGEVGIYTKRNPDSVRAADVAFISNERLQQIQSQSFLDVAPELIVEIMSPDDRWSEIHKKLTEYFAVDVTLIWIVDPKLEQIHVYRSLDDVTRLTKEDNLTGESILPEFSVSLTDIFVDQN